MTDFEKWLQTTPEYKTLVFQHGERLALRGHGDSSRTTGQETKTPPEGGVF